MAARKAHLPLLAFIYSDFDANSAEMRIRFFHSYWPRWQDRFVGVSLPFGAISGESNKELAERHLQRSYDLQERWDNSGVCPAFVIVVPEDQRKIAEYLGAESPEHVGSFARFLEEGWEAWRQLEAERR